MIKKDLRKKFRNIRKSIGNAEALSGEINSLLLNSETYKNADIVLAYWSVNDEVSTRRIIEKALLDGKRVALPRCTDENGNMEFYYISSLSDLSEGMYGIKEPDTNIKADTFSEYSLCIVPGLSFDKYGYRLGYGKGYYDRFLSCFCGISMGLCYDECLCEELPRDEFDISVNYVITNTKIYN